MLATLEHTLSLQLTFEGCCQCVVVAGVIGHEHEHLAEDVNLRRGDKT